jgi:hypothetical protein
MPSVQTRLERLEKANSAEVRCVWLYVGWDRRGSITDAGDGVYRLFVPEVPATLPPGLTVVLRHPDRDGAEVGAATAAWALTQLALSPRQRALTAQARILVLITASGSEPPPEAEADDAAPPEAEAGPPPAAEKPPPPAAEGPLPPPETQWPEWLPR